jgi:hypothetical protein
MGAVGAKEMRRYIQSRIRTACHNRSIIGDFLHIFPPIASSALKSRPKMAKYHDKRSS